MAKLIERVPKVIKKPIRIRHSKTFDEDVIISVDGGSHSSKNRVPEESKANIDEIAKSENIDTHSAIPSNPDYIEAPTVDAPYDASVDAAPAPPAPPAPPSSSNNDGGAPYPDPEGAADPPKAEGPHVYPPSVAGQSPDYPEEDDINNDDSPAPADSNAGVRMFPSGSNVDADFNEQMRTIV